MNYEIDICELMDLLGCVNLVEVSPKDIKKAVRKLRKISEKSS